MSDPDATTAKQKPAIAAPENTPELPKPPEKRLGSDGTAGKCEAYSNSQLDLFQTFLCNTDLEKEKLSNAINFPDYP